MFKYYSQVRNTK